MKQISFSDVSKHDWILPKFKIVVDLDFGVVVRKVVVDQ
jgi:hypothetical protein